MDLVSGITAFQQAGVMAKVQFAVARKVLDMQQMQGSAALQLVNAASKNVNQAGDALVAAATGMGGTLDTYA
jgi:hypothetical protein